MITKEDMKAFQDYSDWVEDKIVTSPKDRLMENALGLMGEAGEVAEKIKKRIRDDTKVEPEEIVKELGMLSSMLQHCQTSTVQALGLQLLRT